MIQFAKMTKDAVLPRRSNPLDAGMDLRSCVEEVIPAHGKAIVDTGISVSFPTDCYGRVAPRSGLAAKFSLDVLAGVIDCTYTDRIKVILFNHGSKDFLINKGDRIAQLIFEKIYIPTDDQVTEVTHDQLVADMQHKGDVRGAAGFGSTGISS